MDEKTKQRLLHMFDLSYLSEDVVRSVKNRSYASFNEMKEHIAYLRTIYVVQNTPRTLSKPYIMCVDGMYVPAEVIKRGKKISAASANKKK